MMLYSEVKHQRKLVKSLRKKSLWDKSLEEVHIHNYAYCHFPIRKMLLQMKFSKNLLFFSYLCFCFFSFVDFVILEV